MVKKDSISLDQNIESTPTYTRPNQAYLSSVVSCTTTSPINFSATNNIPFPGQKQSLQINTLKRKPSETNKVSVILSPTNNSKPQSVNVAYKYDYLQQQEGVGLETYSPINMKSNERLGYAQGFDEGNSNNNNLNNTNNNSRLKTINTSNNNNNRSVNQQQNQNYQQAISGFTLGQQQQFTNNNPHINQYTKPSSSSTTSYNNNKRSQFQTSLDYGSGSRVNYYNNSSNTSGQLGTTNVTTAGGFINSNNKNNNNNNNNNSNNNSNSKTFQYSYKTDPKLKDSIKYQHQ